MLARYRKTVYDNAYRRRYAGQGRDSVPVELTIQGTLGVDYVITTSATRKFYRFLNSSATPGSVTVSTATPATIDYLAIGGGGGGGSAQGGGGGAGGLQQAVSYTLPVGTHAVTIGRGGAGGIINGNTVVGMNGTATQLGTLVTALGGGYGGGSNDAPFSDGSRSSIAGAVDVGCGGGGKGFTSGLGGIGSQGSNGGRGTANLGSYSGGGGGGVGPGAQGGDGSAVKGGDGGAGISYNIGSTILQLGGGGGGGAQNGATRGFGSFGGGNGNQSGGGAPGDAAQPNTGGGGGGGAGGSLGGAGGTGILIISHEFTPPDLPDPASLVPNVYSYTGADQTLVVPAGTTFMYVYMWAAGGGGGLTGNGGVGAMVQGIINVIPGQTLRIVVGQAGDGRSRQGGGGDKTYGGGGRGGNINNDFSSRGGGRSAIAGGSADIVTAGAGGGGRGALGGRGGLTTGGNGSSPGFGGTQTAGGSQNGGLYSGGDASQDNSGGGGSGYYGGGGGSQDRAGGGGSSLLTNLSMIPGETVLGYESTNNIAAPNSTSPYYAAGIALGGIRGTNTGTGGNGRVVLLF